MIKSRKANVFQTQNFMEKGPVGNKLGYRTLGMRCARCNRHGHVASFCRTQEKNITQHQQYVEPIEPVQLALHPDQMSGPLPYVSEVHERYVPYCANAQYGTYLMHYTGNTTAGNISERFWVPAIPCIP